MNKTVERFTADLKTVLLFNSVFFEFNVSLQYWHNYAGALW